MNIHISQIIIGERQRIDLGDLTDLDSMSDPEVGQILPIIIDQNNVLVDGRRRLAKAVKLGWTEVRVEQQHVVSEVSKQKKELCADIGRKDRTWQEKCIAVAKLHRILGREARANGESWTTRAMASFTGLGKSSVAYMIQIADELSATPQDAGIWKSENYMGAMKFMLEKSIAETTKVIEERRAKNPTPYFVAPAGQPLPGAVQPLDSTGQPTTKPVEPKAFNPRLGIRDRAMLYNKSYEHLWNQQLYFSINPKDATKQFLTGWWFVGGGNISDLYGAYQVEYLERIKTLFPDAVKVVHLFVGSLPPSPEYVRVGLPQNGSTPDITCDAHELSSHLPFKADLIYADPPYSIEDSEHYDNSMVNRERVMQECALCLEPGGYLVWLDQALPIFSNNDLNLVGGISYIRSTGNRFRVVSIFRKPLTPTPSCPPNTKSSDATALPSPSPILEGPL